MSLTSAVNADLIEHELVRYAVLIDRREDDRSAFSYLEAQCALIKAKCAEYYASRIVYLARKREINGCFKSARQLHRRITVSVKLLARKLEANVGHSVPFCKSYAA